MNGADMNDPHIEKLYYRVIIPDHTDYDNAPPISGETDEFKCLLSMDQLIIEMKTHFSSEDEAREVVYRIFESLGGHGCYGSRSREPDLQFRPLTDSRTNTGSRL